MGLEIIRYGGFVCDKCGHAWITKNSKRVNKKESYKKIQEELKNKKPLKCPKCKTKKWNYLGLSFKKGSRADKDIAKLFKKEFGKGMREVEEWRKCKYDINFRIKKIKEEIEQKKEELEEHRKRLDVDKKFLRMSKNELRDLEEELSDLEKIKKRN